MSNTIYLQWLTVIFIKLNSAIAWGCGSREQGIKWSLFFRHIFHSQGHPVATESCDVLLTGPWYLVTLQNIHFLLDCFMDSDVTLTHYLCALSFMSYLICPLCLVYTFLFNYSYSIILNWVIKHKAVFFFHGKIKLLFHDSSWSNNVYFKIITI